MLPSLACPQRTLEGEARRSSLFNAVKSAHILNDTTFELCRIILAYDDVVASAPRNKSLSVLAEEALSEFLHHSLGSFRKEVVAALVLSCFASQSLSRKRVGNNYVLSSRLQALCGRAVLQSISTLSKDYSMDERALLRQALVYARVGKKGKLVPVNAQCGALELSELVERVFAKYLEVL